MKLLKWVAIIAMNVAIIFIARENPTWAADSIRQPASVVATGYDSYAIADVAQASKAPLNGSMRKIPRSRLPSISLRRTLRKSRCKTAPP